MFIDLFVGKDDKLLMYLPIMIYILVHLTKSPFKYTYLLNTYHYDERF